MKHRTLLELAQCLQAAQIEVMCAESLPVDLAATRYRRAKALVDSYTALLSARLPASQVVAR